MAKGKEWNQPVTEETLVWQGNERMLHCNTGERSQLNKGRSYTNIISYTCTYTPVKPCIKEIYRLINLISDCHTVVRTISRYPPRMISRYHPRKK